ncbi:MAG: prepilin-type N-terminal cleavage/methylation domain-containing protein [Opitutaceae bacterium]
MSEVVPHSNVRRRNNRGFTLAEILAALLLMAILVPVTLQAVSVASRAGILGQRKTTAIRIAERVLQEQISSGQLNTAPTTSGSITESNIVYPWTLKTEGWTEDDNTVMSVVTVRVEFNVQGHVYDISASTLYDPSITTTTVTSTPVATTTTP